MENITDIRPLKRSLRDKCRQQRRSMEPAVKAAADRKICNKLLNMWCIREADTVFTYVSTGIEVDTREFIAALLKAGKTVAAPRCTDDKGNMTFYIIKSENDLVKGFFGLDEPDAERCTPARASEKSVCVVPAFMFDRKGFRLGYGKGYYDRFLAGFAGSTVGICYDENITPELIHGKYDRPVDITVTERKITFNR